ARPVCGFTATISTRTSPTGELLLGLGPSDGLCPRARGPSSFARDGTRGARLIEHLNEMFDEDGVPDDTDAGTKRTSWHRPDQSCGYLRLRVCHLIFPRLILHDRHGSRSFRPI